MNIFAFLNLITKDKTMKRSALLFLLIFTVSIGFSQSQRFVLLEHFTNAGCGPCAQLNPMVQAIVNANPDKITSINYHTNGPGFDPMNRHNQADVNIRGSLYSLNFVPWSILGGNHFNGSPQNWNINTVNALYAIPTPMELDVYQRLSPGNDTIHATMFVKATGDVPGDPKAYIAVIEKHIHFNTAPGTNGEKDFYNVMKKLLPEKTGLILPTSMKVGDYVIVQSSWPLANVYNVDQLSLIGFVQNAVNKEVYQAANVTEQDYVAIYNNDVELLMFNNLVDRMCLPTIAPVIQVRNNGNNPVTSLQIKYHINNEEMHTYNWSGNLSKLGIANITLPAVGYQLLPENNIQAYITQVNQVADEYPKNDTISYSFLPTLKASRNINIKIKTDNNPGETTWEIKNSNGDVVGSGGPYTEAATTIDTEVNVDEDDCYQFFIYDAGGNGLCCNYGAGFFKVSSASTTIIQGTSFESMETAQFEVNTVGINAHSILTDFEVYPNPTSNQLFIEYTPNNNQNTKVSVFNQLGQSVYSNEVQSPADMTQKLNINTGNWPAGIYMIRLDNGNAISTRKVSVSR